MDRDERRTRRPAPSGRRPRPASGSGRRPVENRSRGGRPAATAVRERPASRRVKPAKKRVAYRRLFDRVFVTHMLSAVAVGVALVLCFSIFFKVRTVAVSGYGLYSEEDVVKASGVETGNTLLFLNKTKVAGRIMAELPYVDEVRVGIGLPNVLKVEIKELDNTYAVATQSGGYWLINSDGRMVESIEAKDTVNYIRIEGFTVRDGAVGDTIKADTATTASSAAPQVQAPEETGEETGDSSDEETDDGTTDGDTSDEETSEDPDNAGDEETGESEENGETSAETEPDAPQAPETAPATDASAPEGAAEQRMQTALKVLVALDSCEGVSGITSLDVSDLSNIKIWYGTQYEVDLGSVDEIQYKLEYMVAAINQLDNTQTGVLDLTFAEEKTARFTPWGNG